jgi:hypothetical protein
MVPKKEMYLVDNKGNKKAVVLDMKDYKKLLAYIEDLEDVKYVKEHMAETTVPYDIVRKRLLRKK